MKYTTENEIPQDPRPSGKPIEILRDLKPSGKPRPWREKKVRSIEVAGSFKRLGQPKRAERIHDCGNWLDFQAAPAGERPRLVRANFCRERLCPMCQWRRSEKVFWELSQVMDAVEAEHENLVPVFLTLTLKNCPATVERLAATLDQMFQGWHRLFMTKKIKPVVKGWFRALELTYNRQTDEFHPHIHAMLFVERSYFTSNAYMKTPEWVQLWRKCARVVDSEHTICDIRKVRNNKGRRKGLSEVAKYTVKDTSFATRDKALTDHLVSVLSKSLKGRRLYAFGGILKHLAAEFDEGKEDLIHVGDKTVRDDIAQLIKRYFWRFGIAQYVRVK